MTLHDRELIVRCDTPVATTSLGEKVATVVQSGDVVILTGEMGAGKTTFMKGVVSALGGTESVTSPTFVLCHLYDTSPVVAHVDCWRFENPEEVIDLALSEILDDGGVAFLEWGDIATKTIGGEYLRMSFVIDSAPVAASDLSDEQFFDASIMVPRTITFESVGDSWAHRLATLQEALAHDPLVGVGEKTQ